MASLAGITAQYNKKSSAVKRIMQEARELAREPSTDFAANPLETDIFEWHFTIRGPEDTEFEGGLYHGRILLPNNYPFAPPSLMFLTPNGRFELHKKVCLSITGYHPEYWQPAWGIRTVLVAVMGFLPTESKGAIGGLDTSVEARKALAIKSRTWSCPTCQSENISILPDVAPENAVKASLKADELPPEFSFGYEADKKKQAEESDSNNNTNKNEACEDKGNLAESAVEYLPSPSSTGFTPTMSDDIQSSRPAIELESTVRPMHQSSIQQQQGPSAGVQSSSNVPQGLSRPLTPVTGASSSSTTTEIRARTGAATSQSQTQILEHLQAPAQARAQNNRRTESGIPVWLDTLIFIFGGLLVAMVIRKFI